MVVATYRMQVLVTQDAKTEDLDQLWTLGNQDFDGQNDTSSLGYESVSEDELASGTDKKSVPVTFLTKVFVDTNA